MNLHARLTRALRTGVAPLFAAACFVACTGAPGGASESTASASEAVKADGFLHTGLTKDAWKHAPGHDHAGWDDGRRCHPAPLNLCTTLDDDFIGSDDGAACANVTTPSCPDRVDTWDDFFVIEFATALTNDCRFGQWAPPLLSATDVANYLNDLLAFNLQLFGCPLQGTTGRLTFDLIPSALAGDKFTSADLQALTDIYVAAIQQGFSDAGLPGLTDAQVRDMTLTLERAARRVPRVRHSDQFTFSTCSAGTPAPDMSGMDDDGDHGCDLGDR